MKKNNLILVVLVIFFLVTRLYQITTNPPSLYWDEASIGYNAYSILKTGNDEWGQFLPVHFRAFSEFKLPVYIYSVVPFEKVLGINELSVRLPAVLFGLASVFLIYLIAKKLFAKEIIGLLSAFFLTISPWFFIFSRNGYEVVAGLAFFLLGIYLFLELNKNKLLIFLSTISFILSMYSHNNFRILAPLTLLMLMIFFVLSYKTWKTYLPVGLIAGVIFLISFIPIVRLITLDSAFGRLQTLSLLPIIRKVSPPTGPAKYQLISAPKMVGDESPYSALIKNYSSHFSLNFLITEGDKNLRSQQKGIGQLYLIDLIFLISGIIYIIRKKENKLYLPLLLMAIAPLPASITIEAPHALRSLTMVPFLSIILAVGVTGVIEKIKFKYFLTIIVGIYLLFFANYFYNFINVYPKLASSDWQYGYKKIFTTYQSSFPKYNQVVISDHEGQPYIFGLFYMKYQPPNFKQEVQYNPPDKWGFSTVKSFGNFLFQPINQASLPKGHLLIFASDQEKLENLDPKEIIKNLDGSIAFYVYDYQNQ